MSYKRRKKRRPTKKMTDLEGKVVEVAKSYVGQRESPENMGFVDKNFEEKMKMVGWLPSYAWCMCFAELCWKEAMKYTDYIRIKNILRPSCLKTWANATKSSELRTTNSRLHTPMDIRPGAIAIFKSLTIPGSGHAAIVVEKARYNLITIDGNTNGSGDREGNCVARKMRKAGKNGSLMYIGCIYPDLIDNDGDTLRTCS